MSPQCNIYVWGKSKHSLHINNTVKINVEKASTVYSQA